MIEILFFVTVCIIAVIIKNRQTMKMLLNDNSTFEFKVEVEAMREEELLNLINDDSVPEKLKQKAVKRYNRYYCS